jgi:hypothetical protein
MYMGMFNIHIIYEYINMCRFGDHDGYCLATFGDGAGVYPAFHQCNCALAALHLVQLS